MSIDLCVYIDNVKTSTEGRAYQETILFHRGRGGAFEASPGIFSLCLHTRSTVGCSLVSSGSCLGIFELVRDNARFYLWRKSACY